MLTDAAHGIMLGLGGAVGGGLIGAAIGWVVDADRRMRGEDVTWLTPTSKIGVYRQRGWRQGYFVVDDAAPGRIMFDHHSTIVAGPFRSRKSAVVAAKIIQSVGA